MFRHLLLLLLLALVAVLAWQGKPGPPLDTASPTAASPPQDNRVQAGFQMEAQAVEGGVSVRWSGPLVEIVEAVLYRSTSDLARTRLDEVRYPIAVRRLPPDRVGTLQDDTAPPGVPLFYQVRLAEASGRFHYGPVASVELPARKLPRLARPSLLVDKEDYTLVVRDGGRTVKRYPVALGRNPFRRKLHQDNASTPEGRYRVYNLQPQATYYRAYDLDYPTAADRERYELAARRGLLPRPTPGIGGEIQIHGRGIQANWTFGCIALRNEDMDELFAHPEIAAGCPVEIVGRELTRADLEGVDVQKVQRALARHGFSPGTSDGRLGPSTRRALGLFQLKSGLPLTCEPDRKTRELLSKGTAAPPTLP